MNEHNGTIHKLFSNYTNPKHALTTILSENFSFGSPFLLLQEKKEAVIHFSHPKPLLPNDFLRIFVKVKIVRFQGPF